MTRVASFTLLYERGVPLVSVNGPIDVSNVCAFNAVVQCAEESEAPAIIVVLPSSDYICARTYGVLAAAYGRLKAQNRRLLLVCPLRAYSRRIIALLRLPFLLFCSVGDAINDSDLSSLRRVRTLKG
jgi:anti-anti-sigma factor